MSRFPGMVLGVAAVFLVGCTESPTESNRTAAPETVATSPAPAPGSSSITEIAIEEGFTELVGALVYVDEELGTGLVEFFDGRRQLTVFAPTDDAFQELYVLLGVGSVEDLPASVVRDVLLYHVTSGRRAANSVVPQSPSPVNRRISTLLRESFAVRSDLTIVDGLSGVRDEDPSIVAADISARNGIIHVVNQVLVPPSVAAALSD